MNYSEEFLGRGAAARIGKLRAIAEDLEKRAISLQRIAQGLFEEANALERETFNSLPRRRSSGEDSGERHRHQ